MTYYVNLRAGPYGAVCSPYVLSGAAGVAGPQVTSVAWNTTPLLCKGRDVLLAAHGFNVSYEAGLLSMQRLEAALGLDPSSEMFFGVLWPGDWTIPAINYPFEDGVASQAGRLLGGFCNQWLASARSISFLSHSLGARVVLEAVQASKRRARSVCLTAGAVNSACLREEYRAAAANCDQIHTLSSREDRTLEFAFPPGDLAADILDPDHPPFEPALGRGGPASPFGANVRPVEIPNQPPYDHGDYFPPGGTAPPPPSAANAADWRKSVGFMTAAFRGAAPAWP